MLDTPFGALLNAAATGTLGSYESLLWRSAAAVTVVLASAGYPASSRSGDVITGADGVEGVLHAGTARRDDGALVTAGGRVLSVVGTGPDVPAARADAYQKIDKITFDGAQNRTDIAADR